MPVGELLRRVSSYELAEWFAFYDLRANPPKPQQSASEVRAAFGAMARRSRNG